MLPLFKSDYSIGKSILTSEQTSTEDGPTSIFQIAQENNLKELILVEDSLTGFLKCQKNSTELGIKLIFGLRMSFCDDSLETDKDSASNSHKVIIFAKNSNGCKLLNEIYSYAFTKRGGKLDSNYLNSIWIEEDLKLCIPFYDSFIFNNLMNFSTCILDVGFTNPDFFIEDNCLPFDQMVSEKVKEYCTTNNYNYILSKSIYYHKRSDFSAYQTYKCICSRSSFGRGRSLDKPNLDHCSSKEFSFESWSEASGHKKTRN